MAALQTDYYNSVAGTVTVGTTVETVIAVSPAISSPFPNVQVAIECSFEFTTGVGATSIIVRVRRDSLTGTIVYQSLSWPVAASANLPRPAIQTTDSLALDVASQLWVVTVTQAAATGNGTAQKIFTRVTVN